MSYKKQKWDYKVASAAEARVRSTAFVTEPEYTLQRHPDYLSQKIIPEKIDITSAIPFGGSFRPSAILESHATKEIFQFFHLEHDTQLCERFDTLQQRITEYLRADLSLPEIFGILKGGDVTPDLTEFNIKILELCDLLEGYGFKLPIGKSKVLEILQTGNIVFESEVGNPLTACPELCEIQFQDRPDLKVYTTSMDYLQPRSTLNCYFERTRDGAGGSNGKDTLYYIFNDFSGFSNVMSHMSQLITPDNKPDKMYTHTYYVVEGLISACIYENLCSRCFSNWIDLMEIKSKELLLTNAEVTMFLDLFSGVFLSMLRVYTTTMYGNNSFIVGKYTAIPGISGGEEDEVDSPWTLQKFQQLIYFFFAGISIGNDQGFAKGIQRFMKTNVSDTDGGEKIKTKIVEVAEALHRYFTKKEEYYINVRALSHLVTTKLAWHRYHSNYSRYVAAGAVSGR